MRAGTRSQDEPRQSLSTCYYIIIVKKSETTETVKKENSNKHSICPFEKSTLSCSRKASQNPCGPAFCYQPIVKQRLDQMALIPGKSRWRAYKQPPLPDRLSCTYLPDLVVVMGYRAAVGQWEIPDPTAVGHWEIPGPVTVGHEDFLDRTAVGAL